MSFMFFFLMWVALLFSFYKQVNLPLSGLPAFSALNPSSQPPVCSPDKTSFPFYHSALSEHISVPNLLLYGAGFWHLVLTAGLGETLLRRTALALTLAIICAVSSYSETPGQATLFLLHLAPASGGYALSISDSLLSKFDYSNCAGVLRRPSQSVC